MLRLRFFVDLSLHLGCCGPPRFVSIVIDHWWYQGQGVDIHTAMWDAMRSSLAILAEVWENKNWNITGFFLSVLQLSPSVRASWITCGAFDQD